MLLLKLKYSAYKMQDNKNQENTSLEQTILIIEPKHMPAAQRWGISKSPHTE